MSATKLISLNLNIMSILEKLHNDAVKRLTKDFPEMGTEQKEVTAWQLAGICKREGKEISDLEFND